MKTYYVPVPVAEELPEKPDGYFVIMEDDSITAKEFNGKAFNYYIGSKKVKAWLRPVSVSLPDGLDKDAMMAQAQIIASKQYDTEETAFIAMHYMRDLLSPHLAALQERVKGLEAENERLKKNLHDECLRSGEFKSRVESCRNYLMYVEPSGLSVSDALVSLGYNENGF